MATTTRIYLVGASLKGDRIDAEGAHLVRAATQAQAIRHVVRNTYAAEVATQEQLVDLMTIGIKVEDAGEEQE